MSSAKGSRRPPLPSVLTIEEAAEVLRIGRTLAYDQAKAGTLPGLLPRIGSMYRVSRVQLEAFVAGEHTG